MYPDLHRHLDGSLRPATVAELASELGLTVPENLAFSAGMGLDAALARVQALLDDLKAVPTWSGRLRLLGEHLFPGEAYMREVYAPWSRQPLPVLYVVRVLKGMVSWFR